MILEIKVPSPGESITQVQIASWLVGDGDFVEKNTEIAEIESDKATLAISAPESGVISITNKEGDTVVVGQVIATLNSDSERPLGVETAPKVQTITPIETAAKSLPISPLAKKIITENQVDVAALSDTFQGTRISTKEVVSFLSKKDEKQAVKHDREGVTRIKMSPLRQKLAERLVAVKLNTAMLTTFNEVNMKEILNLKAKYNEAFKLKYGYSLSFVSFFAKAAAIAMSEFPVVNAMIDGDEIVYHEFVDINIAVSSPKGLITPLIRDVHTKSVPELELTIKEMGAKAAKNRIALDDLALGTFTITNGGVFGSMMSTPIINPPQSAILGMHNILQRPMAVNGLVEILPMMYIALSYDHRLIDGRESVGFIVRLIKLLEQPIESGLTTYADFDTFLS